MYQVAQSIDSIRSCAFSAIACLTVGIAAGVCAQLAAAINYIPSAIKQTLMFRGGVLGSLHDDDFSQYRGEPDAVGYLIGSALWGEQLTGVIVWLIITIIMVLLVWEVCRRPELLCSLP